MDTNLVTKSYLLNIQEEKEKLLLYFQQLKQTKFITRITTSLLITQMHNKKGLK
jgi:hypothetical protein